jgi:hypothetical protein
MLLTKLITENHIDWDEHLHTILFAYNFQGGHKSYSFLVGVWIVCFNAHQKLATYN